jgi:hypothetical protein
MAVYEVLAFTMRPDFDSRHPLCCTLPSQSRIGAPGRSRTLMVGTAPCPKVPESHDRPSSIRASKASAMARSRVTVRC